MKEVFQYIKMAGQSLQEMQSFARYMSMNTTLIYAHNVNRMNSNGTLSSKYF